MTNLPGLWLLAAYHPVYLGIAMAIIVIVPVLVVRFAMTGRWL